MEKNKKILILSSYHLPNLSGITVDTQRVAEGLVEKGYDCTILTAQHDPKLPFEEVMSGVKIARLPVAFYIGKWAVTPSLFTFAIKYIRNSDILNLHWPYAESFYIGILAVIFRKPLLIIHHVDGPDFSTLPAIIAWPARIALFLSHTIAGFVAKRIVPRTKDFAQHSSLLSLFKGKLSYCYPIMFYYNPDKQALKKFKQKFARFKYKIGFAGRFSRQKGIAYLLEAIPLLKKRLGSSLAVVLVGPYKEIIGENHLAELKDLLNKYRENVIFLGKLTREELFAFYKLLDCFVLPSINRAEAFGQVQVEAMLSGTPVVVTDLPGVRVPVRKTGMGKVVKARDSQALADGIAEVLTHREKYVRPRKKVREEFAPEKIFASYEKAIEELA